MQSRLSEKDKKLVRELVSDLDETYGKKAITVESIFMITLASTMCAATLLEKLEKQDAN